MVKMCYRLYIYVIYISIYVTKATFTTVISYLNPIFDLIRSNIFLSSRTVYDLSIGKFYPYRIYVYDKLYWKKFYTNRL